SDVYKRQLIGFMAYGKSTVGRIIAARLGFSFVDTDDLIELKAGKSVPAIFSEDGEEVFRQYERTIAAELPSLRNTVIATGGGFGANQSNLESLKTHAFVVYLWAPPEVLYARARRLETRPLLQVADPLKRIRELLAQRTPVYQQADLLINTADRHQQEVADIVIMHFHTVQKSLPRLPHVQAGQKEHSHPQGNENSHSHGP
ncbi:MAG: shikimate kinase, partial [Verrucomicrobiae bacterium]|nr:shikimate kinase [Verrucomicrobiae bacterium]